MKKVSEFLDFIMKQVGCYYWYGTFGQTASKQLYNEKKAQYPKYYTASDFPDQIATPKACYDCAGLVKSMWVYPKYNAADDLGATGIYGKCTVKGSINETNKNGDHIRLIPGYLLFKGNDKTKSHVGIYIGNNKIIEAKGHAYGVITSELNDTWKYYAEYYNVDYSAEVQPDPDTPPYCEHIMEVATLTDPLMLREGPGISFPVLYRLPKGTKVYWQGEKSGDWLKVKYRNTWGWAHKDYLRIC